MEIYCCQPDSVWEDKAATFARVRNLFERDPPVAGSLVVLPEMFSTGFSMNRAVIADRSGDSAAEFMSESARTLKCTMVGGTVTSDGRGTFRNEAFAFSPDGALRARYAKQRPFSLAGEGDQFERGDQSVVFPWGPFTVAPLICYDLRFPELFRQAVGLGADLFTVIACWPARRQQHWITLLQARAIENQAFVVGVNRSGADPNFSYPGRSLVVNPHGVIIADAGEFEGTVHARIDHEAVAGWRREFPALRDAGF